MISFALNHAGAAQPRVKPTRLRRRVSGAILLTLVLIEQHSKQKRTAAKQIVERAQNSEQSTTMGKRSLKHNVSRPDSRAGLP